MLSSCLSDVDQLLSEVNVKLCEANLRLSKSSEVKSKRKLLPRVQMILSELEWIVSMSDEDEVSLSSCESLSWDSFNERKCEMSEAWELGYHNNSEVSPIASVSSSPSSEEEGLEDVFQTITPTCPTPTQPTRPASTPVPVPRCSSSTGRVAPQTGPVRTPDTSFTTTDDESETEEVNERKCEPKVDNFVSRMSAKVAALAPLATYKPAKEVEYPQVDLNLLNSHFIKNIPKPDLLPILGCSNDLQFYARVDHRPGIKNFYKEFPFGSDYGYNTNRGIVAVPDHPIHGYVWSGGEWKVHASLPSSTLPNFKVKRGRAGG